MQPHYLADLVISLKFLLSLAHILIQSMYIESLVLFEKFILIHSLCVTVLGTFFVIS